MNVYSLPTVLFSFNTQPPEGGWTIEAKHSSLTTRFNTQPPEGGWLGRLSAASNAKPVSTHSRPKAAGPRLCDTPPAQLSFNTQPPEGGWLHYYVTHLVFLLFQHTAARRRLVCKNTIPSLS